MSSSLQNLLILVGIIIVAGLGYYLYTQGEGTSLHNSQVDNQTDINTEQSLSRLRDIQTTSLDGSVFDDPRFTSLISTNNDVIPEPHGKTNPFVDNN